jgi:hypothetical protein
MSAWCGFDEKVGETCGRRRQCSMARETSVIGTNRDLKSMQRILDWRITELKQLADDAPEQNWISDRLAFLSRQRIAVCATLVNRRIEAARHVVDLSRWFNGNGALFDGTVNDSQQRGDSERPLSYHQQGPFRFG